jgi:hypothetical protein
MAEEGNSQVPEEGSSSFLPDMGPSATPMLGKALWFQKQIAGTQTLWTQESGGAYPYGFFYVPSGVPHSANFMPNLPWSGLPLSGQFVPTILSVVGMNSPNDFSTFNAAMTIAGAEAQDFNVTTGSGGSTPNTTIFNVQGLNFSGWTVAVQETSPGSGIISIAQPGGAGAGSISTVNPIQVDNANGPIATSSSMTINLDYDAANSFQLNGTDLALKVLSPTSTQAGTNNLISSVTLDTWGRTTASQYVTVDTTTSFNSTLTPTNQLQLKDITVSPTPEPTPGSGFTTRLQTGLTFDTKGRVTANTYRDVGMFRIMTATRVAGNVYWTYTLQRLLQAIPGTFVSDVSNNITAYNGLEMGNTAAGGGVVYGLTVGAGGLGGTGSIALGGTYSGFSYDPVPVNSLVLCFKEGTVNSSWWFTAPNPVTGACP